MNVYDILYFFKKPSIQSIINSARDDGFTKGIEHANKIHDIELQKVCNSYELKIIELKSEINILENQYKIINKQKTAAIEKDRIANTKMIKAQEIVLKVQQVLNNISESVVRGTADIQQIRLDIENPVKKILENGDKK